MNKQELHDLNEDCYKLAKRILQNKKDRETLKQQKDTFELLEMQKIEKTYEETKDKELSNIQKRQLRVEDNLSLVQPYQDTKKTIVELTEWIDLAELDYKYLRRQLDIELAFVKEAGQ